MTQEQEYNNSIQITEKILEDYQKALTGKIEFIPSPKFADYDYKVLINGKLNHRNKYSDYQLTKLPLRKHTFAEHCKKYGIKTYFLVRFTDKLCILDLTEEPDKEEVMLARHDRGDDEDIYALYNVNRMRIIACG